MPADALHAEGLVCQREVGRDGQASVDETEEIGYRDRIQVFIFLSLCKSTNSMHKFLLPLPVINKWTWGVYILGAHQLKW